MELPASVANLQLLVNSKIWKLPYRGLQHTLHGLRFDFNLSVPWHVETLCLATRMRTANRTLNGWQVWTDKLQEAFNFFGEIDGRINSIWWSPLHWRLKPVAQVLQEAVLVDRFDVRFADSMVHSLSRQTVQSIQRAFIDNPAQLQSQLYRELILGRNLSQFADFLAFHNFRHLRRLKHDYVDKLCDLVVSNLDQIIRKLKNSPDNYGVIQIIRLCTDTFCVPGRFGNKIACPSCKSSMRAGSENRIFELRHPVVCRPPLICTELLEGG